MHQTAARRLPTPSRPRCPTARRAGAGRACNGVCTAAPPRAPRWTLLACGARHSRGQSLPPGCDPAGRADRSGRAAPPSPSAPLTQT